MRHTGLMRHMIGSDTWRRVLLGTVAAVAVISAVVAPVDPAASRGASCRSQTPDHSLPYWDRQRSVTVIVDSVLLSGKPKLRQVMACRRFDFRGRPALTIGIAERELRATQRRVAPLVVVGVGYNSLWEHDRRNYDTWAQRFDGQATHLVDTLRRLGALQIVWVTVREPNARFLTATGRSELHLYSWYFPYINERLRVLDERRDDVALADWTAVSDRPGLTYDSIHLTAKGGVLMARTIRRAITAEARRQARTSARRTP
ncbi:MAG: hypothetical protein QOK16_4290 [Solirubrobacteraceae bacterium]|jgi:hypothetical protein|nr:hypothetical protein [Solirubrobacteraceae bacterium]